MYIKSRHNVGFRTVDILAKMTGTRLKKLVFTSYARAKAMYNGKEIVLVKPLTYMNRSGTILQSVLRYAHASLEDVVVVCDNLDLEPGVCRLKMKGSSAGHRGLASLIGSAGTSEFKRLYIGIGRPRYKNDVVRHVLGVPAKDEAESIAGAIERAASGILMLLETNPREVMNIINSECR
jgi:PTH1 family peptidyl-tRNA hydrolase